MSVEFRIPISPTQAFADQVSFFRYGLDQVGGAAASARVVVFVGGENVEAFIHAQKAAFQRPDVEWIAVPSEVYDRYSYFGTGNWRLMGLPSRSDLTVLCDADTVVVQPIDELIDTARTHPRAVLGCMAHYPPAEGNGDLPHTYSEAFWPTLFERIGAPTGSIKEQYSADSRGDLPKTPPYYNFGFVGFGAQAFTACADNLEAVHQSVVDHTDSFMQCQISLAALIAMLELDAKVLPIRYNFPNDQAIIEMYSEEVVNTKVIHYLRTHFIDRSKIGSKSYVLELDRELGTRIDSILLDRLIGWHRNYRNPETMPSLPS